MSNRALSILYNFLILYRFDEYTIVLPSNICHDVFFLVLNLKFPFLIVDIEADNLCINRKSVQNFTKKNKVIVLYNHTYGDPHIPYDFFGELKRISHDTIIIDDRCLCYPSRDTSPMDNSIDLIIYSTGHAKQIDLGGNGFGFIKNHNNLPAHQITFDEKNYLSIKKIFNSNINKLNKNSLIDNCLIYVQNKPIVNKVYQNLIEEETKNWHEHKSKLRNIYESLLPQKIQLKSNFNNWRFNILIKNKNIILKKLSEHNLFASSHYPSIGHKKNEMDCKIAQELHNNIINLFFDKYYTEEMAINTVKIINENQ